MSTGSRRKALWIRRAVAAGVAATALAACSDSAGGAGGGSAGKAGGATSLTVYTGQHEETITALGEQFTKETGIRVDVRAGEDADLVNQILEEGDSSPADLYLSEEPGPIGQLAAKKLLAKVDDRTLSAVEASLVPGTRDWVPYAARARVIYYNPKLIHEDQLPRSILDLSDPKWKGKFAYAPSGAFTSTVSYLISSIGADRTLSWLKAIKANGVNEQSNGKVRDTIEAGQHPFGLSNHYYWWILAQQKGGPDKLTSKLDYFDHPDAGSLVLASGAGVLKSSKHQREAQKFLAWLVSADGGQKLIASDQNAQFPVTPGVTSTIGLPPLSTLHPPTVDQSVFADVSQAKDLIVQSGIA
ncbi:MAG TPA: extracellular solute-binding protein [Mycobacteriales bacterium]|nr:extracellular solute-binding protein [Mycobacteriales bacterium]